MKFSRLTIIVFLSLICTFAYAQEAPEKEKREDQYVFARYNLRALHLDPRVDFAKELGPERSGDGPGHTLVFEADQDYEDLIGFIEKNAAVGTWEDTDARIEQTEDSFRIYQTRAAHKELRQLWTYMEHLASSRANVYFELLEVPKGFNVSAGDRVSKDSLRAVKALLKAGKAKRIWSQRAKARDGEQLVARTTSKQVLVTSYDYQEVTLTQSLAPIMETFTDGVEIEVGLTMAHSKLRFDVWAEELKVLAVENRTVGTKLLQCPKYRKQQMGSRFYADPGETIVLSKTSSENNSEHILLARISKMNSMKAPATVKEIRRYPFRSICARTFKRNPSVGTTSKVVVEGAQGGVLNFDDEDEDEDQRLAEELVDRLLRLFPEQSSQFWRLGETLFVTGPKEFQERVKKVLDKGIPPVAPKMTYEVYILSVPDHAAPDSESLSEKELATLLKSARKSKVVNLTGLAGNKAVYNDYTSIQYLSNVISYQRIDKKLDPVLVPETNTLNLGLVLELTGAKHSSGQGANVTVKIMRADFGGFTDVSLGPVKVQLPTAVKVQRLNEVAYFGTKSDAQVIEQSGKNGVTKLVVLKAKLVTEKKSSGK